MKFFGAVLIFLLAFAAVVFLIVLLFVRKLIIRFRQHLTGDYDEETFKRMADKHYRGDGEGPQFDRDYFKGSGTTRKGTGPRPDQRQRAQQQAREQQRTTTSEGVTIIDERSTDERRKIFTQDEGEYVEFTEE